eukprot:993566-Pelagomonas_calceolata.AAC.1
MFYTKKLPSIGMACIGEAQQTPGLHLASGPVTISWSASCPACGDSSTVQMSQSLSSAQHEMLAAHAQGHGTLDHIHDAKSLRISIAEPLHRLMPIRA